METYLGIDFGGTKLLIGEVRGDGQILRSKRYDTGPLTQEEALEKILAALTDYRQTVGFEGSLRAAGMGIVGVVDYEKGLWISMNHEIKGPPIPLERFIQTHLDLPAAIDNDVRSATTAELMLGHGRNAADFIYVNVGTGLAAGFVSEGRIIRGAHNNSGEVGHMCCDLGDTTLCVCGRFGCAENVLSGVGFTAQYHRLKDDFAGSKLMLEADGRIDAAALFSLCDAGDPLAACVAEYGARILASLVMNLVRVTDPELVVLGGGMVSDGWLLKRLKTMLNAATMRGVTGGVVLSAFDPKETGLIGAAALGMERVLAKA